MNSMLYALVNHNSGSRSLQPQSEANESPRHHAADPLPCWQYQCQDLCFHVPPSSTPTHSTFFSSNSSASTEAPLKLVNRVCLTMSNPAESAMVQLQPQPAPGMSMESSTVSRALPSNNNPVFSTALYHIYSNANIEFQCLRRHSLPTTPTRPTRWKSNRAWVSVVEELWETCQWQYDKQITLISELLTCREPIESRHGVVSRSASHAATASAVAAINDRMGLRLGVHRACLLGESWETEASLMFSLPVPFDGWGYTCVYPKSRRR